MDFGQYAVIYIVGLCYLIGIWIRCTKLDNKWIPAIVGTCGVVLGAVAFFMNIPDFPADNLLAAMFIGAASGLASTGIDQVIKQLKH